MSNDSLEDVKIKSAWRRNAPLLLGVVFVLIIGPFASQLLETYRAIVLEHRDGSTLIAFEEKPPKWIDGTAGQVGQVVVKERFAWSPQAVPAEAGDHQLLRLHERYTSTYEGRVIHIQAPRVPSGPHVALIETTEGARLNVPIHGEHLATLQVGDFVKKEPTAWEPVIVTKPPEAPAPAPAQPQGNP